MGIDKNKKKQNSQKNHKKKTRKKSAYDERFKFSFGLFIIFIGLFLLIAFISYLFTWKIDQSFEWSKVISDATVQVDNWSGKTGAEIANIFLNKWFGVSSFVVPFILLVIGLRLLNIKLLKIGKTIRVGLVGMILVSIILGYIWKDLDGYLGSGLGGAHGFLVAKWLNAFIGETGTAFLLIAASFTFMLFSWNDSLEYVKKLLRKIARQKEKYLLETAEGENVALNETAAEADPTEVTSNKSSGSNEKDVENTDDIDFEFDDRHDDQSHSASVSDNMETSGGAEQGKSEPSNGNDLQNAGNSDKSSEEDVELTVTERPVEKEATSWQSPDKDFDPTLELSNYRYPGIELLEDHASENSSVSKDELISNKNKIVETLSHYKIQINKIKATIGPTVTLYEIVPAPGIKISKIKNLEDDIALSLSALGIRIIAPIPGKGTIGIEVPNQNPDVVSMKSVVSSAAFQESKHELAVAIGKTISNEPHVFDLAKMPHLLVAGATGQGKSVGLNAIITSLLYKKHPSQIKFVMVDPKKVELTLYSRLEKHFLAKLPDTEEPIITDTQKVINTLNSITIEMDERYELLKAAHVRNLKEYNAKFIKRKLNPEKGHKFMPYIVIIIDEFADLIMTAGKEIEMPLARIAQLARAVGIHLIIATQRPTTNIITGVIKANFPARIAFRVISSVDSRTILDSTGANQLIGRGDMLIFTGSETKRIQCAFIDTDEVEAITDFISKQQGYSSAFELPEYVDESSEGNGEVDLSKRDELFDEAARVIVAHQQGSTSLIQRKFSIGYNRAGRLIDQLEAAGVVGPFEGSKARQVLVPDEYQLEKILNNL